MRRTVRCSWGCGALVSERWRPYPPASGVVGHHWEVVGHECGVVRRAKFGPYVPAGVDLGVGKRAASARPAAE